MLEIRFSSRFNRDLKLIKKRGYNTQKLKKCYIVTARASRSS